MATIPTRLNQRHRAVARLLAMGRRRSEIAAATGYAPWTVTVVQRAPGFAELVKGFQREIFDATLSGLFVGPWSRRSVHSAAVSGKTGGSALGKRQERRSSRTLAFAAEGFDRVTVAVEDTRDDAVRLGMNRCCALALRFQERRGAPA
jgi:hypothetical protein